MPQIKSPNPPHCPKCDKLLDGYTDTQSEGQVPKAGDMTICAYCHTIAIFEDFTTLRLMTFAEQDENRNEIIRALLEMMQNPIPPTQH
jgi:hypothetical protein